MHGDFNVDGLILNLARRRLTDCQMCFLYDGPIYDQSTKFRPALALNEEKTLCKEE